MTNDQAIGYMILSAQEMGLDKEVIRELESNMKAFMEDVDQEEIQKVYNNFI